MEDAKTLGVRRFLTEWALLTLALGAPYFIFDEAVGVVADLVLVVGWLGWHVVAAWRHRKRDGREKDPHRIWTQVYAASGPIVAGAALGGIASGWIVFAYSGRVSEFGTLGGAFLAAMGFLLLLALACQLVGLAMLRRRGVLSGSLRTLLARAITRPHHSGPLYYFAFVIGACGLISFAASVNAFGLLADSLLYGQTVTPLDVVALFPILPVALATSAALLVAGLHGLAWERHDSAALKDRFLGSGYAVPRGSSVRTAVIVAGSALAIYTIIQPIHMGLVAALSPVAGITSWSATSEAVDEWIRAERDAGREPAEIAAELNAYSRWSPGAPEEGLVVKFPELAETLARAETCEIALAAGSAEPGVTVPAMEGADEEYVETGVKYCLRVACESPVTWEAAPGVILYTSHASARKYWVRNVFIDVFAEGRAPSPGGYCTAEGELADTFQG